MTWWDIWNNKLRTPWPTHVQGRLFVTTSIPTSLTYPINAQKTPRGQSNVGVNSTTSAFIQLNNTMVLSNPHFWQVEQKVRHWAFDKVMKRLGIKTFELHGKDLKPIVHYNLEGKPIGGGKINWLIALWGYALKLNPAIDDIHRQPTEELEVRKKALEMGFEYLDHPLAYKYIKNQVAIVLKSRHGWLKNKCKKGEGRSWKCSETN